MKPKRCAHMTSLKGARPVARAVEESRNFDVYAWNPKPRAHATAGGEIQAARALFELLSERYPRR